jgi:hypothetical protein
VRDPDLAEPSLQHPQVPLPRDLRRHVRRRPLHISQTFRHHRALHSRILNGILLPARRTGELIVSNVSQYIVSSTFVAIC